MSEAGQADAPGRLPALLVAGREQAGSTGRQTLVSISERVPELDLPSILTLPKRTVAERHGTGVAAHPVITPRASIDRFYWSRPSDGFAMVATGATLGLSPSVTDRFHALASEWDRLLEDALVDDPSNGARGAGPTLLGGFSFDPQLPTSDRWLGFPPALFTLPHLQLARVDGACWLTSNFLVAPSGRTVPEHDEWVSEREALLAAGTVRAPGETPPSAFGEPVLLEWEDAGDGEAWKALVAQGATAIGEGRFDKVVLAREVNARSSREVDHAMLIRRLETAYPACAVFACEVGGALFVGASPEQLVGTEGTSVTVASLAGTAPRGVDEVEDREAARGLLASAKDRREHEVVRRAVVESLEEDCDRISAAAEPVVLALPNVHHLYTPVTARLRPGMSPLHVVRALHPTPAVGGYPRADALAFIREHEQLDRGWYAAPIGWIQRSRSDFAVALRSALIRGTEISLYAGCGVMADSDPESEFTETLLKLQAMKLALGGSVDRTDGDFLQASIGAHSTHGAVR